MWYSRYTEGGGDTHDCQKGVDMIVESDNRCEFCGKKMLTQIYKESYGEYKKKNIIKMMIDKRRNI